MKKLLYAFAISALLLVPASVAHAQISIGIRIGEPPPPRAYRVPRQPAPDFVWDRGLLVSTGESLPVARRLLDPGAV
jgi:hypothetical protein